MRRPLDGTVAVTRRDPVARGVTVLRPLKQWGLNVSMQSVIRRVLGISGAFLLAAAPFGARAVDAPEVLSFNVAEGLNLNSFLRSGSVAAHLVLRSGPDPRILIAFPAGNSGAGLWFAHDAQSAIWTLQGEPKPVSAADSRGRPMYGMAVLASVQSPKLSIKQVLLSNVRVLRDYQALGTFPAQVDTKAVIRGTTIAWTRDRLDGAAGYALSIEVTHGALQDGAIRAGDDGLIGMKIIALTGETPLTPLAREGLVNERAVPDLLAQNILAFLSYQEKFLAGSWRFNTYFGRDTLMSVRLLMPALMPDAVEAGLGAVLARLSPQGEVAHEEDIGEFAILDHLHTGTKSDAPTYNYNMIDGNYMLAPVASNWMLDDPRGRPRARAYLARMDGRYGGTQQTLGADLVQNLRLVIQSATAFSDAPQVKHLIGLKRKVMAGQWRDSDDGLGGGRYPYDVNAVFVPAALKAAGRFYASGLLDPYLSREDRTQFARAATMAGVWRAKAAPLFDIEVVNEVARRHIEAYAKVLGLPDDAALRSVGQESVHFHALALGADFGTVPILHTDEGFELLFGDPHPLNLDRAVAAIMRPFPAGLLTDVGVVVANPVFSAPEVQARFTKNAYHGAVIWSWQQAVLAAGIDRQLQRGDLPEPVRKRIRSAQNQLWRAINAGRVVRNSELWSWAYADGKFRVAPFGASGADVDESNAAQLWSTVYLAIAPPDVQER